MGRSTDDDRNVRDPSATALWRPTRVIFVRVAQAGGTPRLFCASFDCPVGVQEAAALGIAALRGQTNDTISAFHGSPLVEVPVSRQEQMRAEAMLAGVSVRLTQLGRMTDDSAFTQARASGKEQVVHAPGATAGTHEVARRRVSRVSP